MEFLEQGLSIAQRYSQGLSIILMDIDFFKKVNDTYGHNVGDEVLVKVSHTLKSNLRSADIAARIGGEEFLLILPKQNLETAQIVGERLRTSVAELSWTQTNLKVTISGGICDDTTLDPSEMLASADKKLYSAKDQGRNRIL